MSALLKPRLRVLVSMCALACGPALSAAAQARNLKDLATGKLLVASRSVTNRQFRHTVVLLIQVDDKGAAGLVLNRPTSETLAQLFPKLPAARGRTDVAYWGGPEAATQIVSLVTVPAPLREGRQVLPGLYVSTTRALMELALNAQKGPGSFRIYRGYAGWAPGKLPYELAEGRWYVLPASSQVVFDPNPATLWARLTAHTLHPPQPATDAKIYGPGAVAKW
ncbi:MAG: YqgE/AlgH family protein [Terriglobales bacterium]